MALTKMFKKYRLKSHAQALRKRCTDINSLEGVIDEVLKCKKFILLQKRTEIINFCKVVAGLKPQTICEIGSSGGGTLRLLSHFAADNAEILSIDIDNTPIRKAAYPSLVNKNQNVTILNSSSYASDTIKYVKNWLNGKKLDVLFIDGDHAYNGVSKDFLLYSPFVRTGGLIGFHDIVEDYKTRYGQETPAYVGDVPKLWKELQSQFSHSKKMQELIEDTEQDGFGIGLIHW